VSNKSSTTKKKVVSKSTTTKSKAKPTATKSKAKPTTANSKAKSPTAKPSKRKTSTTSTPSKAKASKAKTEKKREEIAPEVSSSGKPDIKEVSYVGFVDTASRNAISGWAAKLDKDGNYSSTSIGIFLDDIEVMKVTPSKFRADLAEAGIGSGLFSFNISTDADIDLRHVKLKFSDGRIIGRLDEAEGGEKSNPAPQKSRQNYPIQLLSDKVAELSRKSKFENLVFYESSFDLKALQKTQKVCIYVTFNLDGAIYSYQQKQVAEFQKAGYFVIAVRACVLISNSISNVKLGDFDIGKKNVGYDFGSWWTGNHWLETTLGDEISGLSQIALCNDSFYGSVDQNTIKAMEKNEGGLVGIVESMSMARHLQSFFVIAQSTYLSSGMFGNNLRDYNFPQRKTDVIAQGELGLSNAADSVGAGISALRTYESLIENWIVNYDSLVKAELAAREIFGMNCVESEVEQSFSKFLDRLIAGEVLNPTHAFWHDFAGPDIGIVKRELIVKNPMNIPNFYSCILQCQKNGIISSEFLDEVIGSTSKKDLRMLAVKYMIKKYEGTNKK